MEKEERLLSYGLHTLRVELSCLGYGRMEPQILRVNCSRNDKVRDILKCVAHRENILDAGFCSESGYHGKVASDVNLGTVAELIEDENELRPHLELWSTRNDPAHDIYQEYTVHDSPATVREGFAALLYACFHLEVARVAAHLPAIDARVDYTGSSVRESLGRGVHRNDEQKKKGRVSVGKVLPWPMK